MAAAAPTVASGIDRDREASAAGERAEAVGIDGLVRSSRSAPRPAHREPEHLAAASWRREAEVAPPGLLTPPARCTAGLHVRPEPGAGQRRGIVSRLRVERGGVDDSAGVGRSATRSIAPRMARAADPCRRSGEPGPSRHPFAAAGSWRALRPRPAVPPSAVGRPDARVSPAYRVIGRAVDLACGTGMSTVVLAEHAESVVGVDVSPEMMHAARPAPGARHLLASGNGCSVPADLS